MNSAGNCATFFRDMQQHCCDCAPYTFNPFRGFRKEFHGMICLQIPWFQLTLNAQRDTMNEWISPHVDISTFALSSHLCKRRESLESSQRKGIVWVNQQNLCDFFVETSKPHFIIKREINFSSSASNEFGVWFIEDDSMKRGELTLWSDTIVFVMFGLINYVIYWHLETLPLTCEKDVVCLMSYKSQASK